MQSQVLASSLMDDAVPDPASLFLMVPFPVSQDKGPKLIKACSRTGTTHQILGLVLRGMLCNTIIVANHPEVTISSIYSNGRIGNLILVFPI